MAKNKSVSRVYHTAPAPPRQRHFPHRRRTVKGFVAPANSVAATTRTEKQDTMTQYFPRIAASDSEMEEEEMELELGERREHSKVEDGDYEDGESGRKRRRLTSKRANQGASKRQETLTQLPNFLARSSFDSGKRQYISDSDEDEGDDESQPQSQSQSPPSPSPSASTSALAASRNRFSTPLKPPSPLSSRLEVPSSQSPAATPLTWPRNAEISAQSPQRSPLQELPVRAITHIDNSLRHRNPDKERMKAARKDEYEQWKSSTGSCYGSGDKCSPGDEDSHPEQERGCSIRIKREPSPDADEEDPEGSAAAENQENYDPIWAIKELFDSDSEAACSSTTKKMTKKKHNQKQKQPSGAGIVKSNERSQASACVSRAPATPSTRRVKREQAVPSPSPLRAMSLAHHSASPASCDADAGADCCPGSPTPVRHSGGARPLIVDDSQDSQPSALSSPLLLLHQTNHHHGYCEKQYEHQQEQNIWQDQADEADEVSSSYTPISSIHDSADVQTVSQLLPDSMLVDDDGSGSHSHLED